MLHQEGSDAHEIVIDARKWVANLPATIQAVYTKADASEQERGRAKKIQAMFVQQFGLSQDDIPLLIFDASSLEAPFALS